MKTEFFPLGDRYQILVYIDLEAGADQRATERELRTLTRWLSGKDENPEVLSNNAYVGYGGPRFFLAISPVDPNPHRSFVLINTVSVDDVPAVVDRVNAFMDANLAAARADAKQMWFGSTEPGIVKVRLIGPDKDVLIGRSDFIVDALHNVPGAIGIK